MMVLPGYLARSIRWLCLTAAGVVSLRVHLVLYKLSF